MSDRDIPLTSFAGIPIRILWPEGALSMPDWSFASYATTRHVPGSNRNITQTLGNGPQTITYRLWLDSRQDLRDLKDRVQHADTLVLFADMTSAPDTYGDHFGEGYVEIPDVLLLSLGTPEIIPDDITGVRVEVDAVFQRSST